MAWLGQRFALIPRFVAALHRRHGGRGDEAKELSQQASLTAMQRLPNYHGLAPFNAWLHRICELTVLGQWRRRRRELPLDGVGEQPDQQPDPAKELMQAEHRDRVRKAIDRVGGGEAEVIRMHCLEELDFGEISRRTGIPIPTLRTRFYRGMEKLRSILRGWLDDTEGAS